MAASAFGGGDAHEELRWKMEEGRQLWAPSVGPSVAGLPPAASVEAQMVRAKGDTSLAGRTERGRAAQLVL